MKDFLRRNAREERDMYKNAEKAEIERKKDFDIIDSCRHDKVAIPENLR